MAGDPNVRSLPQIMAIARAIIDGGKEKEFIAACKDQEALFVVSTDSARQFMASFLKQHQLDPTGVNLHPFSYGNDRC